MQEKLLVLVRWMVREEWRLHSTLFGDGRFFGFPLILYGLSTIAAFALASVGFSAAEVGFGAVLIAAVIGVQTGSSGVEGNDAIKNLLGDVTLLVYSSRTLPVTGRSAIGAFLLKDLLYYAGLFILPIVGGALSGAVLVGVSIGIDDGWLLGIGPSRVISLGVYTWVLATVAFLLGVLVALLATGVSIEWRAIQRSRQDSRPKWLRFEWLNARFGGSTAAPLAAKTVLDVQRSSGGVWKLLLSSAGLMGGVYLVVELVTQHIYITPSYGVLFGALVSMTAFPTYAWVTRIDAPEDYSIYPVTSGTLLRAKMLAFAALELPVVALYYVIVFFALEPAHMDVLVGGAVLVGMLAYVFGLTMYLTRFQPTEHLFDGVVFAKYSAAVMVSLLPLLMVGMFAPMSVTFASALFWGSLVLVVLGWGLYREAVEAEGELG